MYTRFMPIKIYWENGVPFAVCDTVAEAAELLQVRLAIPNEKPGNRDAPAVRSPEPVSAPLSEEQAASQFFADLKLNQRNFLIALSSHPNGVRSDDLAQEVHMETNQFGAIMSNLSKTGTRNGINMDQLIISEARFEGSRRYRFFQPGPLLQKHSAKLIAKPELRMAG